MTSSYCFVPMKELNNVAPAYTHKYPRNII
jgi:hypothetical protein